MPLDLTPLIRAIASNTHSLEELQSEARRAGLHAYYTVLRLPRRHSRLGSRIHALVIHAGLHPEAIAIAGDGLRKEDIEELCSILHTPVIVARNGRMEVYASA